MAFDKIVGVDGTTYQFPSLVRSRIANNISTAGTDENLATISALGPSLATKSDTSHNHDLANLTNNNLDALSDVVIGTTPLADKQTLQYESSSQKWKNKAATGGVTVKDGTPPSTALEGDAWFDSSDGTLYVYYKGTDNEYNWVQVQANSALEGTILARLGAVEARSTALEGNGYRYVSALYFTSSGTFTKATYPWLRAIRVRVQAAGGGGGGASSIPAGQVVCSKAGTGGVYAESFITDIASLSASITVTTGAGGAGGVAGSNAGSTGGSSSFGTLVSAAGGFGGGGPDYTYPPNIPATGTPGPTTGVGDFIVAGGDSTAALSPGLSFVRGGDGGDSYMSTAKSGSVAVVGGGNGQPGKLYGGGGTAGLNSENQATARSGGAGANGIVIVELYA